MPRRRALGCLARGPRGYDYGWRGDGVGTVCGRGALDGIGLVLIVFDVGVDGGLSRVAPLNRLDGWSDVHDLLALAARLSKERFAPCKGKQACVRQLIGFGGHA